MKGEGKIRALDRWQKSTTNKIRAQTQLLGSAAYI
jgi:hypothetical protein